MWSSLPTSTAAAAHAPAAWSHNVLLAGDVQSPDSGIISPPAAEGKRALGEFNPAFPATPATGGVLRMRELLADALLVSPNLPRFRCSGGPRL